MSNTICFIFSILFAFITVMGCTNEGLKRPESKITTDVFGNQLTSERRFELAGDAWYTDDGDHLVVNCTEKLKSDPMWSEQMKEAAEKNAEYRCVKLGDFEKISKLYRFQLHENGFEADPFHNAQNFLRRFCRGDETLIFGPMPFSFTMDPDDYSQGEYDILLIFIYVPNAPCDSRYF